MKLVTICMNPPTPIRDYDWNAYDDSRGYEPGDPVGHGATREAAIADLMEQLES